MKRNGMSKLSASLFVLLLTLSAVGTFPMAGQAQLPTYRNIYIPVSASGSAVTDAWVNLTDLHTGNVIAANYSSQSYTYVVTNAPSGFYRVDVTDPNYYDAMDAAEFVYSGFNNYTLSPAINLPEFDAMSTTWNITVTDAGGNPIMGALVGFYYHQTGSIYGEYVVKATTDTSGNAVFKMFKTTSNYELVIKKATYATYLEPITVSADGWRNITLSKSHMVTSFISDTNGPANNVVAYLINQDQNVSWVVRVLKSYGSLMAFDAYDGTFTLVVDAAGDSAYVTTVTVAGSSVAVNVPTLAPQVQRNEYVNLTYGSDFNSFSLSVATDWTYDDAYPGLPFNDMGSLRAQIDLALGDGNGYLDANEINAFVSKVQSFGPQYISSFGLMEVNDTAFANAALMTGFNIVFGSGAGADALTDSVSYGYSCAYTSHSAIDLNANEYTGAFIARYDSSEVDYQYTISLVNGYELIDNSSTTQVFVGGYRTVVVNPSLVSTGGQETVSMTFQTSEIPVAGATVLSSAYAYSVKVDQNITRYLVAVGQNVTLSSQGSLDPNGNPLTFTWDFGDGTPVETTANDTIVHMYNASASVVANLTVTDVVGLQNWSSINITCDGLAPTPVISVQDVTIAADNSIAIDQRQQVYFNGSYSHDDAVIAGDDLGVIDHVQFDWGDGNISSNIAWTQQNQNVSHAYEDSGHYTLVLNATDVVGNWRNTTLTVNVNDTQAPTLSFVVKNETWGDTLVENQTLYFDATNTTDNVDNITLLMFSWEFGDGNWLNETGANGGANVTHNYSLVGTVTLRLNVTDLSNNSNVQARALTIVSSPRPNMIIDAITYDPPTAFTEGAAGTIVVNMTNMGNANATGIVVTFYIVQADGTQKQIGSASQSDVMLNGTQVSVVTVGQSVQVKFSYTPSNKGTYAIRVNVTSDNQLKTTTKNAPTLTVNQAAWKEFALWGGVLAVIILIPLLLYLRGRWARREKKGPRRERKEKGGSNEE
jgi:hypothetical protein